jgi:vacuolar-type H+-ATPase subunit E/Vma4
MTSREGTRGDRKWFIHAGNDTALLEDWLADPPMEGCPTDGLGELAPPVGPEDNYGGGGPPGDAMFDAFRAATHTAIAEGATTVRLYNYLQDGTWTDHLFVTKDEELIRRAREVCSRHSQPVRHEFRFVVECSARAHPEAQGITAHVELGDKLFATGVLPDEFSEVGHTDSSCTEIICTEFSNDEAQASRLAAHRETLQRFLFAHFLCTGVGLRIISERIETYRKRELHATAGNLTFIARPEKAQTISELAEALAVHKECTASLASLERAICGWAAEDRLLNICTALEVTFRPTRESISSMLTSSERRRFRKLLHELLEEATAEYAYGRLLGICLPTRNEALAEAIADEFEGVPQERVLEVVKDTFAKRADATHDAKRINQVDPSVVRLAQLVMRAIVQRIGVDMREFNED